MQVTDQQAQARIAKLDEVLRGVPYQYQQKNRLRNDVAQLLRTCGTLQPALSSFSGGGRQVTLFYLSGVLPISYRSTTYNIPVTIYFDPPYPAQAPRCFVTPTKDMAIKSQHKHVDTGGMVSIPYLQQWSERQSSLPEMVATIQSVFSLDPPVYSTGLSAAAAAPATAASQAASSSSTAVEPVGFFGSLFGGRPSVAQQGYPQPGAAAVVAQPPAAMAAAQPVVAQVIAQPVVAVTAQPIAAVVQAQPLNHGRDQAVRVVTERAKERWPQILKPLVDEANAQFDKKVELEEQTAKVDAEVERLKAVVDQNRRDEAELKTMEADLRAFNEANAGEELNPDSLREAMDPDAQQVLDSLSEELALEELLVALDELLAGGKLSIDDFMREVRDVSRRQFMTRVIRQKAATALAAATGEPLPAEAAPTPTAMPPAPVVAPAIPMAVPVTPGAPHAVAAQAVQVPAPAPAAAAPAAPARRQLVPA